MKEFRLGRSEYWFDPTTSEAIAHSNRNGHTEMYEEVDTDAVDIYHATEEEINHFKGTIFEPNRLVSNRQIKRWDREIKYKQKGPIP